MARILQCRTCRRAHSDVSGSGPGTMPLAILVAESSGGGLAGFLEIDLRSHADGCTRRARWVMSKAGLSPRSIGVKGSARSFLPPRKIGRAATGASRWRPIPGSTTTFPSARTRRWGSRWSTAVSTTARICETAPCVSGETVSPAQSTRDLRKIQSVKNRVSQRRKSAKKTKRVFSLRLCAFAR